MNGSLLELNLTQPVAASCSTAESIHNDGLSLFPNFKPDPFARSRHCKIREKICSRCRQLLPINQFKKKANKKSGRFRVCHACFDLIQKKVCPRCKTILHFSKFPKTKTGRRSICLECSTKRIATDPNPVVQCAKCLFGLGFGYDRISRQIFGSNKFKQRIFRWRKTHRWKPHFDNFKVQRQIIVRKRQSKPPPPPKPPKPDPMYVRKRHRLKVYLRRKVWGFLKHGQHPKSTATLIGCNRPQFIAYLTPLLQPGMTFKNYGPIWHLDHKIPCKFFDLFKSDQRSLCFHYTNLQPMFAHENKVKQATLPCVDTLHGNLTTLKLLALAAQREFPFQ